MAGIRYAGLALQLLGVAAVAYLITAFWLVAQLPVSGNLYRDEVLRYPPYPAWSLVLAAALVIAALASVVRPRATLAVVALAALSLVYGLVALATKPPEIFGMSLGSNIALASVATIVGSALRNRGKNVAVRGQEATDAR